MRRVMRPLLILDEPTANLDHHATQTLLEMLGTLKQNDTTLLISEHRLHPLPIADSFVYLEKDRIARIWTKDDFSRLAYEDVRSYGLRHTNMVSNGALHQSKERSAADPMLEGRKLAYCYKRNGEGIHDVDIELSNLCRIWFQIQAQKWWNVIYQFMSSLLTKRWSYNDTSGRFRRSLFANGVGTNPGNYSQPRRRSCCSEYIVFGVLGQAFIRGNRG